MLTFYVNEIFDIITVTKKAFIVNFDKSTL